MDWFTLFTDWSMEDPHYFYFRGMLYGVVVSWVIVHIIVPVIKEGLKRLRRKLDGRETAI